MECHDPHSQQSLFEVKDDLCINCHQEDMERYLEDTHVQKGIGCVDCHALVIPPEVPPDDGIVPTGHAFNITPATCVACHTDALHAGFSLPGFESGATAFAQTNGMTETTQIDQATPETELEEETLTPEQRIQTLEAALASRDITTLFQGGVVGLVLGGSTAWIVARNVRRSPTTENKDEENGEKS
jgi:predicted CXXCH cytochrome family protein